MYSDNEVRDATLEYFNGDELATNVWMTKYALKNKKGEYQELTPDDKDVIIEYHRCLSNFVVHRLVFLQLFCLLCYQTRNVCSGQWRNTQGVRALWRFPVSKKVRRIQYIIK